MICAVRKKTSLTCRYPHTSNFTVHYTDLISKTVTLSFLLYSTHWSRHYQWHKSLAIAFRNAFTITVTDWFVNVDLPVVEEVFCLPRMRSNTNSRLDLTDLNRWTLISRKYYSSNRFGECFLEEKTLPLHICRTGFGVSVNVWTHVHIYRNGMIWWSILIENVLIENWMLHICRKFLI